MNILLALPLPRLRPSLDLIQLYVAKYPSSSRYKHLSKPCPTWLPTTYTPDALKVDLQQLTYTGLFFHPMLS
eukprot:scaffold23518_cov225-Skeletonema_marinoi.AAC.4